MSLVGQLNGELPTLGQLLGPMLGTQGPGRLYARSSGVEAGAESNEEYWRWGGASRLRTGRRVIATGSVATSLRSGPGQKERVLGEAPWLGWTDRLLQPRHLYVWGRNGEDWRIDRVAGWSDVVDGAVEVTVQHIHDGRPGSLHVMPKTGWVMVIRLEGLVVWELFDINENPDVSRWPLRDWFEDVMPERDHW